MSDTILSRIMNQLDARWKKMSTDYPEGDPYTIRWGAVRDTQAAGLDAGLLSSLAMFAGSDRTSEEVGMSRCVQSMTLEFHVRAKKGESLRRRGQELIGDLKRAIKSDIYTVEDGTGVRLTLNLSVTGSELDIASANDTIATGAVFFDILYRHKIDDPRRTPGEAA